MADVKVAPKKILPRCAEQVKLVRLVVGWDTFAFGGAVLVRDGGGAKGTVVEAMYLHPAGLAVITKAGPYQGQRLIIPWPKIEFLVIADEEP